MTNGPAEAFDQARFRQVLGRFATGVAIVAGTHDGEPVGMTAQSFTSVSLQPPLVSLCPGKDSSSWPRIRASGSFCANILGDDQEAICRIFATKGADKFRGVGWRPAPSGSPIIDDVLAWVDARIEAEHDAGDHVIVVGRVLALDVGRDAGPLVFYRGGFGRFEV